jgi:hypothetical protein
MKFYSTQCMKRAFVYMWNMKESGYNVRIGREDGMWNVRAFRFGSLSLDV